MSLLDDAIDRVQQPKALASGGFGVVLPESTMMNTTTPSTTGTDLAPAPVGAAPDMTTKDSFGGGSLLQHATTNSATSFGTTSAGPTTNTPGFTGASNTAAMFAAKPIDGAVPNMTWDDFTKDYQYAGANGGTNNDYGARTVDGLGTIAAWRQGGQNLNGGEGFTSGDQLTYGDGPATYDYQQDVGDGTVNQFSRGPNGEVISKNVTKNNDPTWQKWLDIIAPAAISGVALGGIGAGLSAGLGGAAGLATGATSATADAASLAGAANAGLSIPAGAVSFEAGAFYGAGGVPLGAAGAATGAATALAPVAVTAGLGAGTIAGGAAGGAVGAAATSLGTTASGTPIQQGQTVNVNGSAAPPAPSFLQAATGGTAGATATSLGTTADGTPIQQGETVNVTSNAAQPPPAVQQILPYLQTALSALTPLQTSTLNSAMTQQSPNLPSDQSKWSLDDWAKYAKIAAGLAGLVGSGGASSSDSPATTAGAIQVPTTTPFLDPTIANTQAATGGSVLNAANGLTLPTTNYAAAGAGSTSGGTAAGTIAPAATPNTSAGFTAGAPTKANLGTVTADQTVADNLTKLLAANSPLIEQARSRAIQAANARGLQNSTLAGQSGEEAAIAQSLPIAQQDAATYQKQSLTNQTAQDTANALNENIRQSDNATGVQQQSLLESQRQFDATTSANAAKLAEQSREYNLDAGQKDRLAQLDTNTKTYLANVQAQYQNQTQSSASATALYNSFQDQVAQITMNANMDAANKQAAINIAASNLKNGMAVLGKINGLDLSSILQFQTA